MNKYCIYYTDMKPIDFRKIRRYRNLIELFDYQLTPGLFFEGEIYRARIVKAEDPDINFDILTNVFLDENDIIFEAEDDDSALLIMEVGCE